MLLVSQLQRFSFVLLRLSDVAATEVLKFALNQDPKGRRCGDITITHTCVCVQLFYSVQNGLAVVAECVCVDSRVLRR